MEYEADSDSNRDKCTLDDPQKIGKGVGGVRNWKTSRDHTNCSIVKIG